jgi:hypothetical protein
MKAVRRPGIASALEDIVNSSFSWISFTKGTVPVEGVLSTDA